MQVFLSMRCKSGFLMFPRGMRENKKIGERIKAVRESRGPLTQTQFAERLGGVTRGAVGNWERGLGIKRDNLSAIAETFAVSIEWLLTGKGNGPDVQQSPDESNAIVGDKLPPGGNYIPVYGHAVAGVDGEFMLNGNRLADILAPPGLSPTRGAYAVTVSGSSMEPRYFDGETVFVDPMRRCGKHDFVVAQIAGSEGDPPLAYIKRLVRHNTVELVLEQYNPPKELRFPHEKVVSVHYIVMGGQAT